MGFELSQPKEVLAYRRRACEPGVAAADPRRSLLIHCLRVQMPNAETCDVFNNRLEDDETLGIRCIR